MNIITNPFCKFKLQHKVMHANSRDLDAAWRGMSRECKQFMFNSTVIQFMRGMSRNYKRNIVLSASDEPSTQKEFLTISNRKIRNRNCRNRNFFNTLHQDIFLYLCFFLNKKERLTKLAMLDTYCFRITFTKCGNSITINEKNIKAISKDKLGILNYNHQKCKSITINQVTITKSNRNVIENMIKSIGSRPASNGGIEHVKLSVTDFDKYDPLSPYVNDWSSKSTNIMDLFLKLKDRHTISFENITST